ncbi:uncharacterized protein DS421_4g119320 [Arachis hypogaea]|nr:uncharacterized protein DS421_4g119320 [Arachis hypogaea]
MARAAISVVMLCLFAATVMLKIHMSTTHGMSLMAPFLHSVLQNKLSSSTTNSLALKSTAPATTTSLSMSSTTSTSHSSSPGTESNTGRTHGKKVPQVPCAHPSWHQLHLQVPGQGPNWYLLLLPKPWPPQNRWWYWWSQNLQQVVDPSSVPDPEAEHWFLIGDYYAKSHTA